MLTAHSKLLPFNDSMQLLRWRAPAEPPRPPKRGRRLSAPPASPLRCSLMPAALPARAQNHSDMSPGASQNLSTFVLEWGVTKLHATRVCRL